MSLDKPEIKEQPSKLAAMLRKSMHALILSTVLIGGSSEPSHQITPKTKTHKPISTIENPHAFVEMINAAVKEKALEAATDTVEYPTGLELIKITGDQKKELEGPRKCRNIDVTTEEGRDEIRDTCMFHDVRKTTAPLVKIFPHDLDQIIGGTMELRNFVRIDPKDKVLRNFDEYKEYTQSCDPRNPDSKERCWRIARIDPELVKLLVGFEAAFGRALTIDEGYRPYAYNVDMYALQNCVKYIEAQNPNKAKIDRCIRERGFHPSGRAVDVDQQRGLTELVRSMAKTRSGEDTYGVSKASTIVHFDTRKRPWRHNYNH